MDHHGGRLLLLCVDLLSYLSERMMTSDEAKAREKPHKKIN